MSQLIDVLLINLGTPDAATLMAVRRYLREFLNDPRVIDIPSPLRLLLLYGVFLPFRSKKTTAAYQQIWQPQGSPLLLNSIKLQKALQTQLGETYRVSLAMRYGNPNIEDVITQLTAQRCEQLIIVPLYPQYASSSTGTALEKALTSIGRNNTIPALKVINHFYNHPLFIESYAQVIDAVLTQQPFDKLLFSYHGLPERHIDKSGCERGACDRKNACPPSTSSHSYCYRNHCFTTSRLLAEKLGLTSTQYQVSFQSRLGKTPWITPYTDYVLPQLFAQGVRNLVVVCPSFTCDCLETLEEIGIRGKQQWQQLGGTGFTLIPCLNDHPEWVSSLAQLIIEPLN